MTHLFALTVGKEELKNGNKEELAEKMLIELKQKP